MQLIGYRDSGQDRVGSLNDDDTGTAPGTTDGFWRNPVAAAYGGRLVVFAASAGPQVTIDLPGLYRRGLTLRRYGGAFEPGERIRNAVAQALQLVAAGRAGLGIGRRFTLREGAAAFAAVQHRTPGKVLLDIAG